MDSRFGKNLLNIVFFNVLKLSICRNISMFGLRFDITYSMSQKWNIKPESLK